MGGFPPYCWKHPYRFPFIHPFLNHACMIISDPSHATAKIKGKVQLVETTTISGGSYFFSCSSNFVRFNIQNSKYISFNAMSTSNVQPPKFPQTFLQLPKVEQVFDLKLKGAAIRLENSKKKVLLASLVRTLPRFTVDRWQCTYQEQRTWKYLGIPITKCTPTSLPTHKKKRRFGNDLRFDLRFLDGFC